MNCKTYAAQVVLTSIALLAFGVAGTQGAEKAVSAKAEPQPAGKGMAALDQAAKDHK